MYASTRGREASNRQRVSYRLATIPGIGIARNQFLFKGVTCSDSFFHTLKDIYIQSIIAILINFDAQFGKILINFPWVPTWKRNHDRSHDSDSLGAKESESDLESHFEESLQAYFLLFCSLRRAQGRKVTILNSWIASSGFVAAHRGQFFGFFRSQCLKFNARIGQECVFARVWVLDSCYFLLFCFFLKELCVVLRNNSITLDHAT